jgi:hypothetical protein
MQVVFGECILDVGDMPSKEAALSSARESTAPANGNGASAEANGKNGSSEHPKEVLPGLSAEAMGDHDDARKSKSAPPKRA